MYFSCCLSCCPPKLQKVDARTLSQFRAGESAEKACAETLWEEKDAGSQRVGRAGPNWKDPASRPFEKPAKGREIGVENEPLESAHLHNLSPSQNLVRREYPSCVKLDNLRDCVMSAAICIARLNSIKAQGTVRQPADLPDIGPFVAAIIW